MNRLTENFSEEHQDEIWKDDRVTLNKYVRETAEKTRLQNPLGQSWL